MFLTPANNPVPSPIDPNNPSLEVSESMTFITDVNPSTTVFMSSLLKRFWATDVDVSDRRLSLKSRLSMITDISASALPAEFAIKSIDSWADLKLEINAARACPFRLPANTSSNCHYIPQVHNAYELLVKFMFFADISHF